MPQFDERHVKLCGGVVVWDGVAPWSPGVGAVALQLNAGEWCEIGAVYDANASPRFALAI